MVTQKAISARIQNETLWNIEQEHMIDQAHNRNRILNEGARMYLDLINADRAMGMYPDDEKTRRKILLGWLQKWWPRASYLIRVPARDL